MSNQNNNSDSDAISDDFDLDQFRPNRVSHAIAYIVNRQRRRVKYASFLKGPISWAWIKAATQAGRDALFVGLNLHRYRDLRRTTEVQISLQKLGDGVLPRRTVRGLLRKLEDAGLIKIRRVPGHLLAVTLLDIADDTASVEQRSE
jgi:hypothetical protein